MTCLRVGPQAAGTVINFQRRVALVERPAAFVGDPSENSTDESADGDFVAAEQDGAVVDAALGMRFKHGADALPEPGRFPADQQAVLMVKVDR